MSMTDQAFIRAYKDPAARKAASGPASDAAPVAAASSIEVVGSTTQVLYVESVEVGLGSVIPPPHAKFNEPKPSSEAELAKKSISRQAVAAMQSPPTNVGKPHLSFGNSPRASLSSFASQATSIAEPLEAHKPALEVDAVCWPAVCLKLLDRHAQQFDRLVEEILQECAAGRNVIGITGIERGEGRTTLALCLARRLAARKERIALVDADFASPRLAESLGLGVDRGLETVIAGRETLWDVMIESVTDRLAILPSVGTAAAETAIDSLHRMAGALRNCRRNSTS